MTYLGVLAGRQDEFHDWVRGNFFGAPDQLGHNRYRFGELEVRYLPHIDAARGIIFSAIVVTGTYDQKWHPNQIQELQEWVERYRGQLG